MSLSRLLERWIGPLAAIAFIWGALFLYLARDRTLQLGTGRTAAANLTLALEESLIRTIREIDQTLLYVRALRTRDNNAVDLAPWIESVDPENRLAAQISIADRNGIVTISNLHAPTKRVDLSDRAHFRHFREQSTDHLFISEPVLGRVSKLLTIQFVRMIKGIDNAFDGIVVLSVPPEHLVKFYEAIDIGKFGRISVVGLDGIVRASAGGSRKAGDRLDAPFLADAQTQQKGQFRWIDPADGLARIGSFRKLAGYPLLVSVELAEFEVTAKNDRAAPDYLAVGAILTLIVILFVMTAARQRQRAEAAQRLTDLALQHVGLGIMVVSPTGHIGVLNHRAREILELPASFRADVPYSDLIAWQAHNGELTAQHIDAEPLQAMLGPRPWRDVPARFRRSLPSHRIVETRTEPLQDGTIVHSFADITAEEEAQRVLTEARDAAETAMRARAQFLAAMSHEIRTPLNGILGVNELLRCTSMTEEQYEYANIIQQAGEHLLEMLTEILDYSKIDHQGVELERIAFDPGSLARQVVALMRPRALAQGLVLNLVLSDALPLRAMGDPHRIRQILINLISNAIKFTAAGTVNVTLGAARADNDRWQLDFAVADTGIGIDAAELCRLFQEFTQTDGSITRRFGGTGLGLAICRRLVEAMDGQITVTSVKGQGSTFRFGIPCAPVAPETKATSAQDIPDDAWAARIARRAPVVLVAEDSPVNRLVATRMLEQLGCHVRVVENGRQVLQAVQAGDIDLVLMDVMMPEMDGLAATRAIRAMPGPLARLPIVGLSANAFRSDQGAARAAGMNGFATKPINRSRLGAEIIAALQLPAVPAPEPDPPSRDVSVLANLCETLGVDTAMAVVEAFQNDAPAVLRRLQDQVVAGHADGVAREAHALAGSAGTLGLVAIQDAARHMERAARSAGSLPDRDAMAALEAMTAGQVSTLKAELEHQLDVEHLS